MVESIERLKQGRKKWGKWRSSSRPIRPDLRGANLAGLDLVAFDLSDCDLQDANLCGADLTWSNLTSADLSGARCVGTDLTGARLIGTKMQKTDLTSANLTAVEFSNLYGAAADLTGAILVHATLTPKGKGLPEGGFLELATAEGLETVDFGQPGALLQYLRDAFAYAHDLGSVEAKEWPQYVNEIVQRIRSLQSILSPSGEPPSLLQDCIVSITTKLINEFRNHPERLYQLPPRQFEELIAELLASFGWQVQLTAQARDGGYDLFAVSNDRVVGVETSWIIECKRYAPDKPVRISAVRALYGAKHLRPACNLLFATTSYFTSAVHQFKASTYDLTLKDYSGIVEWINVYRPNPTGRLFLSTEEYRKHNLLHADRNR